MMLTSNQIDYIPYIDPNKMVDRLRYLISQRMAGNTSDKIINEIIEIKCELGK